jgi:uncharacterized membrane protein
MELFGNVYLPMPFWGWDLLGTLISVLIVIAIVKAIIHASHGDYRSRRQRRMDYYAQDAGDYEARRILDERYAKGEINDEEYKKKKENLK